MFNFGRPSTMAGLAATALLSSLAFAQPAGTAASAGQLGSMSSGSDKNSGRIAGSDKATADKPANTGGPVKRSTTAQKNASGAGSSMTSGSDKNSGRIAGSDGGASTPRAATGSAPASGTRRP